MDKERMAAVAEIEAYGAKDGWVAPMAEEDRASFCLLRYKFYPI